MRAPFLCILFTGIVLTSSSLFAQTPGEGDADLKRQVGALRDAVIQQTRQIDALTAEIERLGVAMGQRRPAKAANGAVAAPESTETPVVNTTNSPAQTPTAILTPTPDPSVIQHTVVKGDNLTNIAKKYGTTVEAIQKLNKITDARKMQVGQVLSIPTPAPTPALSPAASPVSSPAVTPKK